MARFSPSRAIPPRKLGGHYSWNIEAAFGELATFLNGEIDTLGTVSRAIPLG